MHAIFTRLAFAGSTQETGTSVEFSQRKDAGPLYMTFGPAHVVFTTLVVQNAVTNLVLKS